MGHAAVWLFQSAFVFFPKHHSRCVLLIPSDLSERVLLRPRRGELWWIQAWWWRPLFPSESEDGQRIADWQIVAANRCAMVRCVRKTVMKWLLVSIWHAMKLRVFFVTNRNPNYRKFETYFWLDSHLNCPPSMFASFKATFPDLDGKIYRTLLFWGANHSFRFQSSQERQSNETWFLRVCYHTLSIYCPFITSHLHGN